MDQNIINSLKDRNLLISGARGMIAGGLISEIISELKRGTLGTLKLILVSRSWSPDSLKKYESFTNVINIEYGNLVDLKTPIDIVFHTASPSNITQINDFDSLQYANLDILNILLKLSPSRVVFLSSSEIYAGGNTNEESKILKFSKEFKREWYPLVKFEAEAILLDYFARNSMVSVSVIRLFHTYGPGLREFDGRAFADFLWGAARNKEIILKSSGNQIRTFLYLDDAVAGIFASLMRPDHDYFIYNLGSSNPVSIFEFATRVAKLSNSRLVIHPDLEFLHSPILRNVPVLDRAKMLGWQEQTDLDTGIYSTLKWIHTQI